MTSMAASAWQHLQACLKHCSTRLSSFHQSGKAWQFGNTDHCRVKVLTLGHMREARTTSGISASLPSPAWSEPNTRKKAWSVTPHLLLYPAGKMQRCHQWSHSCKVVHAAHHSVIHQIYGCQALRQPAAVSLASLPLRGVLDRAMPLPG